MSYSQLVLSEKPIGYWDCASTNLENLIDLTSYQNNAVTLNANLNKKPIIYGPGSSIQLLENSTITISNIYNLFISGSEEKACSIEFFFSIKDSSTTPHQILKIGNFLKCYVISDRIYIETEDRISSIKVKKWESSNYVCIKYGSKSVSINFNNDNSSAIYLGDDFEFTDSTPPNFIFGPSSSYDSPMYLNSIAIYSYSLILSEMIMRQSWSRYDSKSERLAIANNADLIFPSVDEIVPNFSYSIDTMERFLDGEHKNIIFKDNYITLPSENPAQVFSLENNPDYILDIDGLSLAGDSYISIDSFYKYFSGDYNIIRQQVQLDGLSSEQTILHMGPMLDKSSLRLYKSIHNTIVLEYINNLDEASIISESQDLGSDFTETIDVGVYFIDGEATLLVNEIIQTPQKISSPAPEFDFYLGNSFYLDSPLTSKIKNFTVDYYENGQEIVFTNIGNYTLKFNGVFSVSQRGEWNYSIKIPEGSVGGLITYNYASKNCNLYVNDAFVESTSLIPNISYESGGFISIEVELKTENSLSSPSVFSGVSISTYDSLYIPSSNGRYRISPTNNDDSNSYVSVDPFLLRYDKYSALDRPSNLGIKFTSFIETQGDYLDDLEAISWVGEQTQVTSGCVLTINSENPLDRIEMLEFLIKLDRVPSEEEEFCIFEIDGTSINLKYSNSGIKISDGYELYIDGEPATPDTILEEFEFYHFVVKLESATNLNIILGTNSSKTLGLDASLGSFAIHKNSPPEFNSYINLRYNSIIGRPSLSKLDQDSIHIFDQTANIQEYEYSQDGKYFAMKELPKIKIIQNKWQTLK
jgi:hypothetical protein